MVRDIFGSKGWTVVAEPEWKELRSAIANLRTEDLRNAGVPVQAPWCGVLQHTLPELEESLAELADVYETRPDLRGFCRSEVIRAKDRARFISTSPSVAEEKQQLKREMLEWMLVWLGDPNLFRAWAQVRKQAISLQKYF